MLKCYKASGWFTESQNNICTKLGNYLLSKEGVSVFRPRVDGVKLDSNEFHDPELRKKVFMDNVTHIDEADFIVANLDGRDGFLDTGTVWEVGYAMAKGIPVIAYQEDGGKLYDLINPIIEGFVSVCIGLDQLDKIVSRMKLRDFGISYPYRKGIKTVYAAPDNTKDNIDKGSEIANVLLECCGNNLKWVDKLSEINLATKASEIFDNAEYFVAVIDDRHPIVTWLMGQAYARKVPTISYTNYDFGINIMLGVSVIQHVKGINVLKDFIQVIKREGIESLGNYDNSNIKMY